MHEIVLRSSFAPAPARWWLDALNQSSPGAARQDPPSLHPSSCLVMVRRKGAAAQGCIPDAVVESAQARACKQWGEGDFYILPKGQDAWLARACRQLLMLYANRLSRVKAAVIPEACNCHTLPCVPLATAPLPSLLPSDPPPRLSWPQLMPRALSTISPKSQASP